MYALVGKCENGDDVEAGEKGAVTMTIDLLRMKKRLEEKRERLLRQIAGLTEAHPTPVGPVEANEGPRDFEEAAVDFLETQQEQSLLVNEQALLTEVQAALQRLEDGSYGRCIACGQPIPEARLEAMPWAARCVKDEAALEQRNLSREELYPEQTM
jgi:DnaK suppressor protein